MTPRRASDREAQRLRPRRRLPAVRDAGRDARGPRAATTASSWAPTRDRSGGVCPMLAAHRCGGRTDFRSFARAWDRFTGAGRRARSATERELRTLTAQLEASVWRRTSSAPRRCGPVRPCRAAPPPTTVPGWAVPRWDGYRDAVLHALGREPERERRRSERSPPARGRVAGCAPVSPHLPVMSWRISAGGDAARLAPPIDGHRSTPQMN